MNIAGADLAEQANSTFRLSGWLVCLLASLAAIGTLSTNIILPSFPAMGIALDVPTPQMGLLLSVFFIVLAAGQLVVGPLSDCYGRSRLVVSGLAVFIAGSLLCAMAETFEVLLAGRIIQAAGVCAAVVLSRAIARDLFDGEVLARVLSITMVAMAAAPGFSPLLGGALDAGFGWRVTFVFVAVLGALLAGCYLLVIGETHQPERRSVYTGAMVIRAYAALLADTRFILPAMAGSLIMGGLYAFFSATPGILMGSLGLLPLQVGIFFAATVVVVFAAGISAPRLAHKWGIARVISAGIVIALAGGAGLLLQSTPDLPGFILSMAIFLFGMGLVNPLTIAMAMHPFGSQAGQASALVGFLQMACAAIATVFTSLFPLRAVDALAVVIIGGSLLSLLIFLPYLFSCSKAGQAEAGT
ncbi:multidrug effflux MFS transporter [Chromatiaceae bacterium AAb-1]|nr:multidrug effflux MFS transporter [Chromatiaceae bacterium AAb-1]